MSDASEPREKRYWDVKIAFYAQRDGFLRGNYCDTGAHIGFDDAPTALEAIRLCAEWRNVPPASEWASVECTLRAFEDYQVMSRRPWNPNWK